MRRLGLLFAIAVVWCFGLSAARLILRDGSVIYGRFISGSAQEIVFQDDQGIRNRFELSRVRSLDFDAARSSDNPYRTNEYNRDNRYNNNNTAADRSSGYPSGNAFAVLQPGTEIMVRTNEDINTQTAVEGRSYSALIAQDVLDDSGRIVIPHGSEAGLVIRNIRPGGTLSDANLVLDLDSVRVNGRRYAVNTTDIQQNSGQGIGNNRRTGELVGGGAVVGTLIGAIAGGGKGALIGALAGAVGGGAVQVLTKGKEIRVPAETELHFRLDQPLQLSEMR